MNITEYKQYRYCLTCRKETEHTFIYLDQYLKAGQCESCKEEFNNKENLLNIYLHDMIERVLSKPLHFYHEFEHLPSSKKLQISTYNRLMKRLLKKPAKELQNISQIWGKYEFHRNHEA
jgi:hypothetical protein